MFGKIFQRLKVMDWYLTTNIFLLVSFGLAALYSLQLNVDNPDFSLFRKQLVFFGIGLALYLFFSMTSYKLWANYYKIFLILAFAALAGVLFAGVTIGGTRGWFNIFGQTFQPVEFAKIALIIFLSRFFGEHAKEVKQLKYVLLSALLLAAMIGLVFLQPDLGSSAILLIIWFFMMSFLPLSKKSYFTIIAALVLIALAGWFFVLQDYQQQRILTFVNPQSDPLGSGYNIKQSIVAVGSGTFFGRGLSLGSQSQLNFLPAQETDFIFAVIAEELGFVGAGILLLLFFSLFIRLYKILKQVKDGFAVFFVLGVMIFMISQLLVNIGMNIGLMPVTGLTLPFVSYGGSSMLSLMMALGIIQNIYSSNKSMTY